MTSFKEGDILLYKYDKLYVLVLAVESARYKVRYLSYRENIGDPEKWISFVTLETNFIKAA